LFGDGVGVLRGRLRRPFADVVVVESPAEQLAVEGLAASRSMVDRST
jgi:hypothetical protein